MSDEHKAAAGKIEAEKLAKASQNRAAFAELYLKAMRDIASGIKILCDAGMGAGAAGDLAAKIYFEQS